MVQIRGVVDRQEAMATGLVAIMGGVHHHAMIEEDMGEARHRAMVVAGTTEGEEDMVVDTEMIEEADIMAAVEMAEVDALTMAVAVDGENEEENNIWIM